MGCLLTVTDSRALSAIAGEAARARRRVALVCRDVAQARHRVGCGGVDLVLLDARMRGIDERAVAALRAAGCGSLLVCASVGADARSLKRAGADAVISPHHPRLAARIAARLRGQNDHELSFGSITLEPGVRGASVDGRALVLTRAEHAILVLLVARRGDIVTKQEIVSAALGSSGSDANAYFHVHNLKTKLAPNAQIASVWGDGYRLTDVPATSPSRRGDP